MARPINTITTMQLPDGKNVAFVDWTDRPLFSTADVLNGATDERIPLFNYVVGDPVSGTQNLVTKRTASERDTNISTPGAMASTEEFMLFAMKPEFFAYTCTGANANALTTTQPYDPIPQSWRLAALAQALLLEIRVSQKTMQQAPLAYFNAGFGVFQANLTSGNPGLPSQEAVRALSVPVHIGGQEKYEVALVNASGLALAIGDASNDAINNDVPADANRLFQVRVMLDGLYKRPVA